MLAEKHINQNRSIADTSMSMVDRQTPLMQDYKINPSHARVIDRGRTSSGEISTDMPIYGHLTIGTGHVTELDTGAHRAVGGESDLPNPGEIFAGAIAACLDSAMRMIANRLNIRLANLQVTADAMVDVRGTLSVDRSVPVGFQSIEIGVNMSTRDDISEAQLAMLLKAAERSCVMIQTLKNPPEISINLETT